MTRPGREERPARALWPQGIAALCDADRARIYVDCRTSRTAPARSWVDLVLTPSGAVVPVWNL